MMKKTTKIILAVVAAILVLTVAIVGWGISTRNGIVELDETVATKAADLQSQLQRRADLIPNLVNTVKGYAEHETEIFTALADARAKLNGAGNIEELQAANDELSSALSRLLVVVENYPTLKANENFIALQDELSGTENRINIARMNYNEAVKDYNVTIRKFPASVIAGIAGFEVAKPFEADAAAQQAPSVEF